MRHIFIPVLMLLVLAFGACLSNPEPVTMYWASVEHSPPPPVVHTVLVTDAGDKWHLAPSSPDTLPNGEQWVLKGDNLIFDTQDTALRDLLSRLRHEYDEVYIRMQVLEDEISSVRAVLP